MRGLGMRRVVVQPFGLSPSLLSDRSHSLLPLSKLLGKMRLANMKRPLPLRRAGKHSTPLLAHRVSLDIAR